MDHNCHDRYTVLNPRNKVRLYGPAIHSVIEWDGHDWAVCNDEYGTYVAFCPFCGIDLSTLESTFDVRERAGRHENQK